VKGELTRDEIREMIREQPEFREGRLSEEQVEEVVADIHSRQEEIVRAEVYAFTARELIRLVNKGEAEYDPETETYRLVRD
jgi:hypothetical protein